MKWFEISEFDCKCGCGKNNISKELVELLDETRELAGVPFVIESGCRCALHNIRVGGKPTSAHLDGLAVDIHIKDSRTRWIILESIFDMGFIRIGVGKNFVHVDIDRDKDPKVLWMY